MSLLSQIFTSENISLLIVLLSLIILVGLRKGKKIIINADLKRFILTIEADDTDSDKPEIDQPTDNPEDENK